MTGDQADSVPGFIVELIRAANEIDRVSIQERGAMLRRAAITIRQFEGAHNELGDAASVNDFVDSSMLPRVTRDDDVRSAMLHAAQLIRLLQIAEQATRTMSFKGPA